jgi:release factor glutamine methyltransferase
MSVKDIVTVKEALRRASSSMSVLSDGRFLAEIMVRHVLGWNRTELFTRFDEQITAESWGQMEELVQRRLEGVPIQYLLGEQEFYGLPFQVGPSVLIPRPETEILVEEVLRRRDTKESLVVADIGTGSGAIAVTLAVHSAWTCFAVDIAQESLDLALQNSRVNGVDQKVTFLQGDMLEPLKEAGCKVDILVSNPPYIPTADIAELDIQVRVHEPMRALDGGDDGLVFYRTICAGLPDVLRSGGLVAFEVGMGQAEAVSKLLQDSGMVRRVDIIADLAGIDRIVVGY